MIEVPGTLDTLLDGAEAGFVAEKEGDNGVGRAVAMSSAVPDRLRFLGLRPEMDRERRWSDLEGAASSVERFLEDFDDETRPTGPTPGVDLDSCVLPEPSSVL